MAIPSARSVFFSFHYDRDIFRVQQIKNHHMTKLGYQAAGYFDGSLQELAKKEGPLAVKRAINAGLLGSSVTCILIGNQTYTRDWVDYEIFRSIEAGKGIIGIRIHQVKCLRNGVDTAGPNPFDYLGFGSNNHGNMVPYRKLEGEWVKYDEISPINPTAAGYLEAGTKPVLSSLFTVYDWVADNGYINFPTWIQLAATQAGR